MENLLEKVYSESAEQKYKNKEVRENAVLDFSTYAQIEEYKIEEGIDLDALENMKFSIDNKNNK